MAAVTDEASSAIADEAGASVTDEAAAEAFTVGVLTASTSP